MRPVIFGLAGHSLSEAEKDFFRSADPAGFILFARNVDTPDQVQALIADLRTLVDHEPLTLIDQEGGRVARLKQPHWARTLPVARLCEDSETAADFVRCHFDLIAAELRALGITVACAPVLDVPVSGADPIIGDRAFGDDPEIIARLGRVAVDALMAGGVLPVIKHIPGHGKALVDSHLDLPVVPADHAALQRDFQPFKALNDAAFAMTAHIAYEGLGAREVATFSQAIVKDIIRGEIGFNGLLMTDDLSMKALDGSMTSRAEQAVTAGCDLLLHCNGNMTEMKAVLAGCPKGDNALAERIGSLQQKMSKVIPVLSLADCRARYATLVAELEG